MATIQENWWVNEFAVERTGQLDYLSRDGRTVVEIKQTTYGSRGLYSAVMQLALFLEQNLTVDSACLVLCCTRMSLKRLKIEWQRLKDVLRPQIARRLSIIVVEDGETWLDPDEPYFRRIARVFELASPSGNEMRADVLPQQPGQKSHEILKVLLSRWLQRLGPIAIGELSKHVGCSYPTVRKSLDNPFLRNGLEVRSNRSVELKAFPHDAWRALVAISNTRRNSHRFRDQSGEIPTPQRLLKRLEKIKPTHVALGGVVAARYWHPNFDLHGMPRLDLVYHAQSGRVDLDFVRTLDPALARVDDPSESAVLVIHPLVRAAPHFVERNEGGIPWADPVETALDLCDLSLTMQANQLLTHLRPEVRIA